MTKRFREWVKGIPVLGRTARRLHRFFVKPRDGAGREEIKEMMERAYARSSPYTRPHLWDEERHNALVECLKSLVADIDFDNSVVLDIGCGDGGVVSGTKAKKLIGIDISELAIERARGRYPHNEYHACDMESYRGEVVDVAFAVEAVEHFYNFEKAIRNVARHVRPGGYLILTTPNRDSLHLRINRLLGHKDFTCCPEHVHEFTLREMTEILSSAGFVVEETRGCFLTPYWGIPEFESASKIRELTDDHPEVVEWMKEMGRTVSPEYAFCIILRARRVG